MNRRGNLARLVAVLILTAAGIGVGGAQASNPATTIFSFDDGTLPFRYNLSLTMVPATKYPGNPVLNHGTPDDPDERRAQFYGSVIRAGGKFRMWYLALALHPDEKTLPAPKNWPAYAESADGIHWTKPKLGLVDFHGGKQNNLLAFSPAPHFEITQPLAAFVLYEPSDPDPTRRYKMALYGRYFGAGDENRKWHKATIYPYFSADGLTWQLATPAPKGLAYDESEAPFPEQTPFELGGLYKFGGVYTIAGQQDMGSILLATGQPGVRTMDVHYSPDFIHWSHDYAISFVRYGYRSKDDLNEAHEPAAVWNRNNVLLATYGEWQGNPDVGKRRMSLGLLISNDGVHFREPRPDFVFLSPGKTGEWDQHGLIHGQGFENIGDWSYIYYGAWDLSAGTERDPYGAVGLATLRRDGFGYLSVTRAGSEESLCTTLPLALPPGPPQIRVNATGLGPEARLRIELLDATGVPLPNYSGPNAAIATQDGIAEPVPWKAALLHPSPGPIRLRIHFEGRQRQSIHFYAAYLE